MAWQLLSPNGKIGSRICRVGVTAPDRMKLSKYVSGVSAFLIGAVAVFAYLSLVNPDQVCLLVTVLYGISILSPTPFLLILNSRFAAWLIGLCMVAGVFIGACLRLLIPLHASNIWPFGAVIWTAIFLLPIILGSAAGFLARRKFQGL